MHIKFSFKIGLQVAAKRKMKNCPSCHILRATRTATGTTAIKTFQWKFVSQNNLELPGTKFLVFSLEKTPPPHTKKVKKIGILLTCGELEDKI